MSYVLALWAIGLLILLHETGHLLGAKLTGIPISRFSLGFGRKIWGVKIGQTEYRISAIPCGGYVLPAVSMKDGLDKFPLGSRILFTIAGPAANIVAAFLCIASISVMRSGISVEAVLFWPLQQTWETMIELCMAIPSLFEHPEQLSGVLGIVTTGGENIGMSLSRLLIFCFLLNTNLFILNLLPIPPLDGGRIVIMLMQRIYAPLKHLRIPLALGGWVALTGVIAYATTLDVLRIINGVQ